MDNYAAMNKACMYLPSLPFPTYTSYNIPSNASCMAQI